MASKKNPVDAQGRVMPRPDMKNQEAEFVHWFYVHFLGEQPDATSYSYGTSLLRDLMSPGPTKHKDAVAYTVTDLAGAAYYLRDKGVRVNGLEIFKTYDLMRSFVLDRQDRLERLVAFFLRVQGEERGATERTPDGW